MDDFSQALEMCGARGAQYVVVANHDPASSAATKMLLQNVENIKTFGFSNLVLEGPSTPTPPNESGQVGFMGQGLDKDPFITRYLKQYGNTESAADYQAIWKQGGQVGLGVHVIGSPIVFNRADPASLLGHAQSAIELNEKRDRDQRSPLMSAINSIARNLTSTDAKAQADAARLVADLNQDRDGGGKHNYYIDQLANADGRVREEVPKIAAQIQSLKGPTLAMFSTDYLWRAKDLDEALGNSVCRIDFHNGKLSPAQKISMNPLQQGLGLVSNWNADAAVDVSTLPSVKPVGATLASGGSSEGGGAPRRVSTFRHD